MTTRSNFTNLCSNLVVDNEADISARYKQITKRLNQDFYGSDSETSRSYYVGSYGRDTAIRNFHDLDVLFKMPNDRYARYDGRATNGQSALLQEVRGALRKTYPNTDIGGDGQVVAVHFKDRMRFEILPAFLNTSGTYTYPDSNGGGCWRETDPFTERDAITEMNKKCEGNLKRLCRMARAWRRENDVAMKGWLVDTLAYAFIKNWKYRDESYGFYDWMGRDFFLFLSEQDASQKYWLAPGSGKRVYKTGAFRQKAKDAHALAESAIAYEINNRPATARNKWREIYGTFYP